MDRKVEEDLFYSENQKEHLSLDKIKNKLPKGVDEP